MLQRLVNNLKISELLEESTNSENDALIVQN